MLKINQKIDNLLLDGILNPENYSGSYPCPLNTMLREELISLGVVIDNQLHERLTFTSTDNITRWFLDDLCLVESKYNQLIRGAKPKYSKPYRESMYSWVTIKNPELVGWETYRDVDIYAHRMATVCDYLENIFISLSMDNLIADKLMKIHHRQKSQIENVIGEIQIVDRSSFYYGRMLINSQEHDMQNFWSVIAVSYLRAKARFERLLAHNSLQNSKYLFNAYSDDFNSNMWLQFYKDAEESASIVLDYLYLTYPEKETTERLRQVLDAEELLINEINEYNK